MNVFRHKSFFPISAFLLLFFLFTGCVKNRIQEAVDELNEKCPMSLGSFFRIMESTYADDIVTIRYELDERLMNISAMDKNKDLMKKAVLATYGQGNDNLKKFTDVILSANATLNFIYEGSLSGDRISLTITSDELRRACEGKAASPQEMLNLMLSIFNVQAPIAIADGFTITCMREEGDYIYYIYEVSEPVFSTISNDIDNAKANTRISLENMSDVEKADLRKIPTAGKNLGYRYVCPEKGDSVEFSFTTSQLKDILR